MVGGFDPSLAFLNKSVPLWFTLLMAFTTPYMWSTFVKKAVEKRLGTDTESADSGDE